MPDRRRYRILVLQVLVLVAAYLFSAVMSLGYLVAYPGAIAPGRPLIGTPQSIGWIYNCWVVGFALLTFAAVLVEMSYGNRRAPDLKARLLATVVPTLALLAALLIIGLAITVGDRLPLLALTDIRVTARPVRPARLSAMASRRRLPRRGRAAVMVTS